MPARNAGFLRISSLPPSGYKPPAHELTQRLYGFYGKRRSGCKTVESGCERAGRGGCGFRFGSTTETARARFSPLLATLNKWPFLPSVKDGEGLSGYPRHARAYGGNGRMVHNPSHPSRLALSAPSICLLSTCLRAIFCALPFGFEFRFAGGTDCWWPNPSPHLLPPCVLFALLGIVAFTLLPPPLIMLGSTS